MNGKQVDILLVEDNPTDAELTLRVLQKFSGAEHVCLARDGAEALDYIFNPDPNMDDARLNLPRLVLLDLKLPKVDGLEVLRRIKNDPGRSGLPVVIFTSSNQIRDIRDSYLAGANSYVVKPVDFTQFTQAIQTIGFYWLSINQPHEG
jgi:two-component system response regulator